MDEELDGSGRWLLMTMVEALPCRDLRPARTSGSSAEDVEGVVWRDPCREEWCKRLEKEERPDRGGVEDVVAGGSCDGCSRDVRGRCSLDECGRCSRDARGRMEGGAEGAGEPPAGVGASEIAWIAAIAGWCISLACSCEPFEREPVEVEKDDSMVLIEAALLTLLEPATGGALLDPVARISGSVSELAESSLGRCGPSSLET